jgi:hypothetical protein
LERQDQDPLSRTFTGVTHSVNEKADPIAMSYISGRDFF